ncbi:MAG: hypothetical protein H7A35_03555 [Planctomycetales bacterium]|nr:hypothetical protein [bacterium]UNM09131.1 MAG: hypothetical protein H7A35_03555 [Planctomycetales bacterium]
MKRMMMAITAGLAGGLLLANLATAQDELEGKQPQPVGDVGYQSYTVELPRRAWTIGMQLHDENGEISEQSITVLDGFVAEAMSSSMRGYQLDDESMGQAVAYKFQIWFVPDSKLEEWQAGEKERAYFDPSGQAMMSSTAESTGPGDGQPMGRYFSDDNGRRELLLANAQEIRVDELHIFIYAPEYPRIDLSVDKLDYRHFINGVFSEDEDVLKAEDIPFELEKIERPSHIADIVLFTAGEDLGFITADGVRIGDEHWGKAVEEVEEVEEVK